MSYNINQNDLLIAKIVKNAQSFGNTSLNNPSFLSYIISNHKLAINKTQRDKIREIFENLIELKENLELSNK